MEISIKRKDIVEPYINDQRGLTFEKVVQEVIEEHQQAHGHSHSIHDTDLKRLKTQFKKCWQDCSFKETQFRWKFRRWLNEEIKLTKDKQVRGKGGQDCDNGTIYEYSGGISHTDITVLSEQAKRKNINDNWKSRTSEQSSSGTLRNIRKDGKDVNAPNLCPETIVTQMRKTFIDCTTNVVTTTASDTNTYFAAPHFSPVFQQRRKRRCERDEASLKDAPNLQQSCVSPVKQARRRMKDCCINFFSEKVNSQNVKNISVENVEQGRPLTTQRLRLALKEKLNAPSKSKGPPIEHTFTPVEALSILINTNMTRENYNYLRKVHQKQNCRAYPPYQEIMEEKQECYPDCIEADDHTVVIPLQNLVDHTTKRLFVAQESALDALRTRETIEEGTSTHTFELLWKYGHDEGGCYAAHDIEHESRFKGMNDENMVLLFLCPLRLSVEGKKTPLWSNPVPSSPLYHRPIRLYFKEGSSFLDGKDGNILKEEIKVIKPTKVRNLVVKHKIIQPVMQDRTLQSVTHSTAAATCYVCIPPTKPAEMNDLKGIEVKATKDSVTNGLASQHLLLSVMECILHVGYRMKMKTWKVKGQRHEKWLSQEKNRIHNELRKQLGINIDDSTNNNGNIARLFFQASEEVSKITDVDINLIKRFWVLLSALTSGCAVDVSKYKTYAMETAELYVSLYHWYYMPLMVHKILLHGSEVIKEMTISVELVSEEDRLVGMTAEHLQYAHNTPRAQINEDLMHTLLVSSDPLIASSGEVRHARAIWEHLDLEVLNLLKKPDVCDDDSDGEDSDDDSDDTNVEDNEYEGEDDGDT